MPINAAEPVHSLRFLRLLCGDAEISAFAKQLDVPIHWIKLTEAGKAKDGIVLRLAEALRAAFGWSLDEAVELCRGAMGMERVRGLFERAARASVEGDEYAQPKICHVANVDPRGVESQSAASLRAGAVQSGPVEQALPRASAHAVGAGALCAGAGAV